jgi:hypothetical protein
MLLTAWSGYTNARYYRVVTVDDQNQLIDNYKLEKKVIGNITQNSESDAFGNKRVHHVYLQGDLWVINTDEKIDYLRMTDDNDIDWECWTRTRGSQVSTIMPWFPTYGSSSRKYDTYTHTVTSTFCADQCCSTSKYEYKDHTEEYFLSEDCVFHVDPKDVRNSTVSISGRHNCGSGGKEYLKNIWVKVMDWSFDMSCADASPSTGDYWYLGRTISSDIAVDLKPYLQDKIANPQSIAPDSLVNDFADKVQVPHVNNCENLSSLRDLKENIPPIVELIKKHNLKSVADMYLWYKYSYKTTELDIREYVKWLLKFLEDQKSVKQYDHYSLTYPYPDGSIKRFNIYTNPYSIGILEALGLRLDYSNAWDCVPTSFIIDWMYNFGDAFNQVDNAELCSKINILSCMTSYKRSKPLVVSIPFIKGRLYCTVYDRWVEATLPESCINMTIQDPSKHLIDGLALLITNKHKKSK